MSKLNPVAHYTKLAHYTKPSRSLYFVSIYVSFGYGLVGCLFNGCGGGKPAQSAKDGKQDTMHNIFR